MMKQIRLAYYFIVRAFKNLKDNLFINVTNILTIAIAFLIFSASFLVYYNLNNIITQWTGKIQIVAYLKEGISDRKIANLKLKVKKMPQIQRVEYVSKDAALRSFRNDLGEYQGYLEGLTENPLPSSLNIQLNPQYREYQEVIQTVEALRGFKEFDDFQYGQRWLENFSAYLYVIKFSGFFMGALILIATCFIVANSIKIAVFSRRNEIEITKLVGATDTFVKIPFHLEGLFIGLLGSLLSVSLLYIIFLIFLRETSESFPLVFGHKGLSFLPQTYIAIILACGALTGMFGSIISLRKFKVI
jgi:cell division transport system permease protein